MQCTARGGVGGADRWRGAALSTLLPGNSWRRFSEVTARRSRRRNPRQTTLHHFRTCPVRVARVSQLERTSSSDDAVTPVVGTESARLPRRALYRSCPTGKLRAIVRIALLVQVVGFLVQRPLLAQQSANAALGPRVRVAAPGAASSTTGEVVAVTSDSLFIETRGGDTRLGFRRADISRLEVSVGQRRNTLKGLGIGALAGAATGIIAGFASGNDSPCVPPPPSPIGSVGIGFGPCDFNVRMTAAQKASILGVALGIAGGAIGSVTGALTRSDLWVTVSQSAAVAPFIDGRGRLGLAIGY